MKNKTHTKSIKSLLFKPFKYVAGEQALVIGIISLFVLAAAGFITDTYFDGVLDIHYGCLDDDSSSLGAHLIYVFASWIILSTVMYLTALFLKQKIRLVDMFGTLAMAKIPYLIAALVGLIPSLHLCIDTINLVMGMGVSELGTGLKELRWFILISLVLIIPVVIWYIILLYNAFHVSSNQKGIKGIIAFIIALIISEIISIFILPILVDMFGV